MSATLKISAIKYGVWIIGAALAYGATYVEGKGIGGGASVLIALAIRKFEKDVVEPYEAELTSQTMVNDTSDGPQGIGGDPGDALAPPAEKV